MILENWRISSNIMLVVKVISITVLLLPCESDAMKVYFKRVLECVNFD